MARSWWLAAGVLGVVFGCDGEGTGGPPADAATGGQPGDAAPGGAPADLGPEPDAAPDPNEQAWAETLADVQSWIDTEGIPGAGVAVVLDGRLAYSGGLGVRSQSTGEPVTGDTLFRSSSAASKTAVAVALLDLAEEGRLDLQAPIGMLVPAVQLDPTRAAEIDLDVVLRQRSGVMPQDYRPICAAGREGVLAFFEDRGLLPSQAPPEAIWEYSALGAVAGAAVLETVEGRPFTEVLRERVLVPAGMETATYDPAEAAAREHANGHIAGELAPGDLPGLVCGEAIASNGLYASAADHARFLELLLTPGRVLDAASLETLQGVAHDPGFGPGWSYGYYAFGLEYKGERVFHHYGTADGYNGGTSWVPTRGFGLVVLTNGDGGTALSRVRGLEELRWRILDRFLGLTGAEPDGRTPPETWTRYEGAYASLREPATRFTFALDAEQRLTASLEPAHPEPLTLAQGTLDAPYQGGDVFSVVDGDEYLLVAFSPDETGEIRWVNVYSSHAGHHIAERVP